MPQGEARQGEQEYEGEAERQEEDEGEKFENKLVIENDDVEEVVDSDGGSTWTWSYNRLLNRLSCCLNQVVFLHVFF